MQKKLLILCATLIGVGLFFFISKKQTRAGNLTSASATLSNSRFSFYGQVNVGVSSGDTTIQIESSGNADNDVYGLFPGDGVSVGPNGGLTVATIIDSTNFALTTGLVEGASANNTVYATQSGVLTISVGIGNTVPANGYIKVTIPAPPSNDNDGAPDTTSAISTNGFDLNGMGTGDVVTANGTGCTWDGTETLQAGSTPTGSGDHEYKQVTSTACSGTVTVTFDGATKDLVNPAPVGTTHTRGAADEYTITVATYDSGNQLIDTVDIKVAPIEAVLVSATVDETLAFDVAARATGTTSCGKAASVTTTAYSVPWGTLSSSNTFYNAAQTLTVSTNADGGYAVTIEENDQLNKDFNASPTDDCDSPTNSTADETDNCIKDTTCDTSCSESSEDDWETSSNNGFGFSLADVSGSDAAFQYNVVSGSCTGTAETDFCTRQIADVTQAGETKQNIMSNTGPVSGSSAYVCFRISISALQPAGYYINKVKYIATPTF